MQEVKGRRTELRDIILGELSLGDLHTLESKSPALMLDFARWAEASLRLAEKGLLVIQEDSDHGYPHSLYWGINQNVARGTLEFFRRCKTEEDRINRKGEVTS
jgi:hypothetical protein